MNIHYLKHFEMQSNISAFIFPNIFLFIFGLNGETLFYGK